MLSEPWRARQCSTSREHHTDPAALFNGAIKASGGKEITEPNSVYLAKLKPQLDALKDEAGVLTFALAVETGAASTYFSTVPLLTDAKLGAVAMTVGATEYRHAALLSAALMKPITSTMKGFLTTAEAFAPAGV